MGALLPIGLTTCQYNVYFIIEKEGKSKINTLRSYFLAEVEKKKKKKLQEKAEMGEKISTKANGCILNC